MKEYFLLNNSEITVGREPVKSVEGAKKGTGSAIRANRQICAEILQNIFHALYSRIERLEHKSYLTLFKQQCSQ